MTFRQNHCCTLRSLLTSHKMFTAISPPTVNVSNFSKTAASQNRKKNNQISSSPLFSSLCTVCSFSQTRPSPRRLSKPAAAPPLLPGLRAFGTVTGRARSAALPGGLTLCSRFKTGGRKGRGIRKGGLRRAMKRILQRLFIWLLCIYNKGERLFSLIIGLTPHIHAICVFLSCLTLFILHINLLFAVL